MANVPSKTHCIILKRCFQDEKCLTAMTYPVIIRAHVERKRVDEIQPQYVVEIQKGDITMPRGKKKVVNVAEKIEAVKAEIESLTVQLKGKKAELKKLEAEQAEEDKAKLMEAFVASGKSVDEVINWLKGE